MPAPEIIFTTSPTGFGHLRVTQSLISALPKRIKYQILDSPDISAQYLHRLSSVNPIFRFLSEKIQTTPLLEELFSRVYRSFLIRNSHKIYGSLYSTLTTKKFTPHPVIIICTHFSLAHQIAAVKRRLTKTLSSPITLAVVVTDDSPQRLWAIPNSDYIFVPSLTTKTALTKYLSRLTSTPPAVIISPYPLDTAYSKELSSEEFTHRRQQLTAGINYPTQLLLPISGAAVQLSYFRDLISQLTTDSRFYITVVSRLSPLTKTFLDWCSSFSQITVLSSPDDSETINLYSRTLSTQIFALEITKPSEQAFKALLTPHQQGGVILLLSSPVGRQEYDNLNFLSRHRLLSATSPSRALLLPSSGIAAGKFIIASRDNHLLSSLLDFPQFLPHPELRSDGSKLILDYLLAHSSGGKNSSPPDCLP